MPDAGRQTWEIRVLKDIELTPLEKIEVSKSKTKMMKKELKKRIDEWKDNEKWSFIKWSLVWPPWNTIWAYLSFHSKP